MIPAIKSKLVMMLHLIEDAPDHDSLCARYHAMIGYIEGLADRSAITLTQRGRLIRMAINAANERNYTLNLYDAED